MPELPEVETIRRGLQDIITGKKIVQSKVYDSPKSFPNSPSDVNNFLYRSEITSVRRRAKVLMIDLSTNYTLVIHLKMTGQIIYRGDIKFGAGHPNDSLIGDLPDKSTRVSFDFEDGSKLFFNDQRKFGWIKLIPSLEVKNLPFMQKVGPEPLDDEFTVEDFIHRFERRKNTSIKAALLDQTVVAGVGNIYADESLWGAKIDPRRRVKDITNDEFKSLYNEVRYVMDLSIKKGGSTDRNYVDAEGNKGSYLEFARVFRREGQACKRCGHIIEKIKHAGRGTHICPGCMH